MKFLAIALFFTLAAATLADRKAFESYKRLHGRSYDPEEEDKRYQIFLKNKAEIDAHNANPDKTYEQGYYEHMDMEYDEFKQKFLTATPQEVEGIDQFDYHFHKRQNLPTSVNWTTKGIVSRVKDQGTCGSCWTFGTTGVLEGALAAKGRINLASTLLSEQNILDCTPSSAGSQGCNGGWPASTLQFLKNRDVLATSASYPYTGVQGSCRNVAGLKLSINQVVQVTPNNEDALARAIATYGPVTVAVNANKNFINYKGGLFYDQSCNSAAVNHAVLLTGFGIDPATGHKIWNLKNTWATRWGENGYMKLIRGYNMCLVASNAYYVTLK